MRITGAVLLVLSITASTTATVLDSLAPGTIGFQVHQELGEPINGADAIHERYAAPKRGIAEAECWYDSDGFIVFSRCRLVNALSPRASRLLFNITEGPRVGEGHAVAVNPVVEATTVSYLSAGVHFIVVDNVVKEIWRTKPGWTAERLKEVTQYRYEPSKAVEAAEPEPPSGEPAQDQTGPPVTPAPPTPTPLPDIVPAIQVPVTGPPRRLQINRTWSEVSGDVMQGQSIRAFAKVSSANLTGQTLVFSVGIRRPGGSNLKAAKGAPSVYVGQDGVFQSSFREEVLYAESAWSSANALIPLNLVADPAGKNGVYVLSIKAECGGLQSVCETTCFVVGPGYMQFPAIQQYEIDAAAMEIRQSPQFGACYVLQFPLAVYGCRNSQISGYLELRSGDGSLVKASSAWPGFSGNDGRLYSLKQETVMYDPSRWSSYQLFFPQASLPGGPGATQRYCARVITSCNGLNMSFDVEYDFQAKAQERGIQR